MALIRNSLILLFFLFQFSHAQQVNWMSIEKAQELRAEQSAICSEASLLFSKKENILADKLAIKIDNIKIVDFDKEKMNEKIKSKIMEKRGMKNIKVKFFD